MNIKQPHIVPIYPYKDFEIVEESFDIENNYRNETVFALGNGYIGSRGTFEESYPFDIKQGLEGNFINGFYESERIRYGELVYGSPKKSQTMLNVTNAKPIKLFVEDEEFSMLTGEMIDYKRVLDLKGGYLYRNLIWASPKGKKLKLDIKRLVSFNNKYIMAIRYEVTPLNFEGNIKIVSSIDGDVVNHTQETNALIDYGPYGRTLQMINKLASDNIIGVKQKTKNTGFLLACYAGHNITAGELQSSTVIENEYDISMEYCFRAEQDKPISIEKIISYVTNVHEKNRDVEEKAKEEVETYKQLGFDELLKKQKQYMADFWDRSDITIDGDVALQQGLRFNLFHILQGSGRDGKTSMPAKGLTGEGYEGHYFWDTEMYALPLFSAINGEIAKGLLDFRYNTIEQARDRARVMGHEKGALYPWRTINGEEASAYYPQGTAQYHIIGDIAHALHQYLEFSADEHYLVDKGAEIFFETARIWADLGSFVDVRGGKFCISNVTGPDEYTSIVDNNFYTNLMAQQNLMYACNAAALMSEKYPEEYKNLKDKLELDDSEITNWKKAADNMYFHYNSELGIYGQDDTFLYKKQIDINSIPDDKLPMLLNFHPLVVYRYRLAKQADLILGMFLFSNQYTLEEKRRHFDFYETVTLHDSSLSTCIFSMMASDIGYREKAYEYFTCTSRLDLDDYHKNVYAGIHGANMAGTWMCIVYGFSKMRINDGILSFSPDIPDDWNQYSFCVTFRGRRISITVNKEGTSAKLIEGKAITIKINDENVELR